MTVRCPPQSQGNGDRRELNARQLASQPTLRNKAGPSFRVLVFAYRRTICGRCISEYWLLIQSGAAVTRPVNAVTAGADYPQDQPGASLQPLTVLFLGVSS